MCGFFGPPPDPNYLAGSRIRHYPVSVEYCTVYSIQSLSVIEHTKYLILKDFFMIFNGFFENFRFYKIFSFLQYLNPCQQMSFADADTKN